MYNIKPFLKWAGGKTQLLPSIRKLYPANLGNTINKYAEPFVGGGAVLFDILNNYSLKEVYISDINIELINTYKVIQLFPMELINILHTYETEYLNSNDDNRKIYYYTYRDQYNAIKLENNDINIEKAALFIFLNKTCFNGLYRVNKNNLFNVPMGKYKNPQILNRENIINVSQSLKNIIIKAGDYQNSYDFIDSNTFVYIDPPYRPLSKTSSFTSYSNNIFNDNSQKELADFINKIDKKGAYILSSNSDPHNISKEDMFFDELYKNKNIIRVNAVRSINSNASLRGSLKEILINNY